MECYGKEVVDSIEWSGTRVLCVAGDFTKFDEHAIMQIGCNIELILYKYFSDVLLMLEWANPIQESGGLKPSSFEFDAQLSATSNKKVKEASTFAIHLTTMTKDMQILYDEVYSFIMSLGDDINAKELRHYLAFSLLKNFICLVPLKGGIKLWLNLNPDTIQLLDGFSSDIRGVGHWGTDDLEVYIRHKDNLSKAKPLFEKAYQES